MGRKLAFDRDFALEKIMENFWAGGYQATSMRDLCGALSLHLGSVYNALGDKNEIFKQALHLHMEKKLLPRFHGLLAAEDAYGALVSFIHAVTDECTHPKDSPGCFIVNSLLDITNINDDVTQMLHGYLLDIENILCTLVERGQKQGKITTQKNPRALSRSILATFFSFRTMAKINMPRTIFTDVRDHLITSISS